MAEAATAPPSQLAAAMALHRRGDFAAAEAAYRAILADRPGEAEALHLLGVVLFQTRRHEEAVAAIRAAVALEGSKPEFHSNLSLPLRELGRAEEALAAAARAVELRPDYAEAHANRGLARMALGRPREAAASFQQAVALRPQTAGFHNNLGNALRALRRFEEAARAYRQAVALQPAHAQAHYGLGVALDETGRREEALAALREAVRLDDSFADAHGRIGEILSVTGLPQDSAQSLRRALELDPDNIKARAANVAIRNYLGDFRPAEIAAAARDYADRLIARAGPVPPHPNSADPDRLLRVGFVSGDLGEHAVGEFLRAVLGQLERRELRCFAYSTRRPKNAMQASFDSWRYIDELSDDEAVAAIRADGIDILVDLSGYTVGARPGIFAAGAAPVQASWLGYSGTTGNARVHYILADRFVIPPGEEGCYAERPWRLPDSYVCWTPPEADVPVTQLPALAGGSVTFGCFNNMRKISPAAAALWGRLLSAVAGSRLVLKSSGKVDPAAVDELGRRLEAAGIPRERVEFVDKVPDKAGHYRHYNRIDIALDPFPYVGTTTTVEALWMGVPVVTLAGEGFISRVGESLLTTLGHPEWIAADADDYVRRAAELAADLGRLAALRAGLRDALLASPLCDAPRFARALEQAFRGMWRRWCIGRPA